MGAGRYGRGGLWLFQRAARLQMLQVLRNAGAFALQKAIHRVGEGRMCQPVCAVGGHWEQGAGHFVFALGAAFKTLYPVRDAPLQGLVVAGLKVQAVHALQGAPIAAIGDGGR